jgi:adenylate cyclase
LIAAYPNYGEARHALGIYVLTPLGKFDEAVAQLEAAIALEPLSLGFNTALGFILYMARRYEAAEKQLRATLEIDRQFPLALVALAETVGQLDRPEESIEILKDHPTEAIENRGFLGAHLARAGRTDEARSALAELGEAPGGRTSTLVFTSQIHVHLGEVDIALDQMERAVDEGAPRLIWFGVRPLLDPVRDHPRFQRLLDRMRLPNLRPPA